MSDHLDTQNLSGTFPRLPGVPAGSRTGPDDLDAPEQFYALGGEGEVIRRFRLLFRDGRVVSMPYALLPVFVLESGEILRIVAHDLRVAILGRNLAVLEEAFSEERVTWVRESGNRIDDTESKVFVADMQISGEAVEA